jgi:hypothetical protein
MTKLLDGAFTLARQLADDEQDEFDRRIVTTAHKLDHLIDEALEEDDAGLTQEWKPLSR